MKMDAPREFVSPLSVNSTDVRAIPNLPPSEHGTVHVRTCERINLHFSEVHPRPKLTGQIRDRMQAWQANYQGPKDGANASDGSVSRYYA